MQVWNVLHEARWKYRTQKFAISALSHNFIKLYLRNEGMHRQSKKNLLNTNIFSTCPHNMANFGPLTAEIGLPFCGTPANFNWFRVLPSLLQRHHSPEANQTLHDAWPSSALVHYIYIYIFGALAPWQNFARYKIHFTSKSCVLLYWQRYCTALQQRASAKLCGVVQGMELQNFHRGRHLYPAGRPSRWASAHILVMNVSQINLLITSRWRYLTSFWYGVCYLYCQIDCVSAAVQYMCKC